MTVYRLATIVIGLVAAALALGLVNCAIQLIDDDYAIHILRDTNFKSQTGRFMAAGFLLVMALMPLLYASAFITGWPRIRKEDPDWWDA